MLLVAAHVWLAFRFHHGAGRVLLLGDAGREVLEPPLRDVMGKNCQR